MKTRYRVVTDNFAGFEVQAYRWYFPFWIQVTETHLCINTHLSLEDAMEFIEKCKKRLPKTYKIVYSE